MYVLNRHIVIKPKYEHYLQLFVFRNLQDWKGSGVFYELVSFRSPGHLEQSVGHLTRKSGSWVLYPVWQHTFVSLSAFSRRAVVSYWRKYVHEVLVNRLQGLSLPRQSVVRLTDRPDMTLDVYGGCKTRIQQQQLSGHN